MIAGAEKAATSSLKDYLGQHPGILTHQAREFTYFVNDDAYQAGLDTALQQHSMSEPGDRRLLAKSVGIMYLPKAQQRLHEHNPDVKLAILLRHPIDRAYSAFHFARQQGWETLEDFEAALQAGVERFGGDWVKARACDYLNRSRYAPHIKNCFDTFGRANVHVFLLDDLKRDPAKLCNQLFEAMELPTNTSIDYSRKTNTTMAPRSNVLAQTISGSNPLKRAIKKLLPGNTAKKLKHAARRINQTDAVTPPLNEQTRQRLITLFDDDRRALAELIERDLDAWQK